MVPAANPMHSGSAGKICRAKRKAGTATSVCGSAESVAHASASRAPTPRAASTSESAAPSGTLCTPMATATAAPCRQPSAPAKLTPTPLPSPKACSVITPRKSIVLRMALASALLLLDTSCSAASCPSSQRAHCRTNSAPRHTPSATSSAACGESPASCCPSWISPKLAASITPHASACATPSSLAPSARPRLSASGSAPSPAAADMTRQQPKTKATDAQAGDAGAVAPPAAATSAVSSPTTPTMGSAYGSPAFAIAPRGARKLRLSLLLCRLLCDTQTLARRAWPARTHGAPLWQGHHTRVGLRTTRAPLVRASPAAHAPFACVGERSARFRGWVLAR
mmetsp:Transcript_5700/g.17259  ORF Transcript_5700/g.17259 Transcript_5700/m.17259 type:complete len:339 (-) Transcript_5700:99-1115(-)